MEEFDVIIVGGGIGGCCAAISSACRGARVGLFEAGTIPRHKVCGEFLSPEVRPVFRRLGVENNILNAGAREIYYVRLVARNNVAEILLPHPALAISRFSLDKILWEAACGYGVEGFQNRRVKNIHRGECFRAETGHRVICSRHLIHAAGRRNRTKKTYGAKCFGLKNHFRGVQIEAGVTELHTFDGGYCGAVRVEGELVNICMLARYDLWTKCAALGPDAMFRRVLLQCPALARRVANAETTGPWLATGNIGFDVPQPACDGILHCGDGAGFIPPFSGDGMSMAARSGELAGATAAVCSHIGTAAEIYAGAWKREFGARLQWAKWMQPLFMQSSLSQWTVFLASHYPATAQCLLKKTRGKISSEEFVT